MRGYNEITGIQKPIFLVLIKYLGLNVTSDSGDYYDIFFSLINYKLGLLYINNHFSVCNFYVDFKSKMAVTAAH